MRFLVNALAANEVHVSRYYMKRGAYVAAANRAQYAIQHYPQAPAIEEAMVLLMQAYDQLGMKELRDSTSRVLEKNFPNSPYLKGVKRQVPWWRLWDPNW
jgi:outer membrane protein assembly factor BamD